MAREVDLEVFASAWTDGAVVVDVREPGEYVTGHVPGAKPIPLRDVLARVGELPKDRPVYVICASGNRSKLAADWMTSGGVDAYSVSRGTGGWIRGGRPYVTGPNPHESAA
ncbi:rhodanese-like domain-containing protein [Streptomyces sp. GC420]|uniref:rhodanese-like domain-containing protein n=1 Tax=Streptomyces sp. GC420 TaxID=2697568 RepID=UPI0014151423|nr:rhodanese-like domain-containing protein [Streptomyces sp. GC420]NBM21038.1 rhodanese-like domain-containing protein [Streptomyces sp. GC420]